MVMNLQRIIPPLSFVAFYSEFQFTAFTDFTVLVLLFVGLFGLVLTPSAVFGVSRELLLASSL